MQKKIYLILSFLVFLTACGQVNLKDLSEENYNYKKFLDYKEDLDTIYEGVIDKSTHKDAKAIIELMDISISKLLEEKYDVEDEENYLTHLKRRNDFNLNIWDLSDQVTDTTSKESGIKIFREIEALTIDEISLLKAVSTEEREMLYLKFDYDIDVKLKVKEQELEEIKKFIVEMENLDEEDLEKMRDQPSEEEINQRHEQDYQDSKIEAKRLQEEHGNFRVDVLSYGWFKENIYGIEKEWYRVDIKIKNKGSQKDTFSTMSSAIILGNKEYASSLNSILLGGEIRPRIEQEGYLLFEDIPKEWKGKARFIAGSTWDENYDEKDFEFWIEL